METVYKLTAATTASANFNLVEMLIQVTAEACGNTAARLEAL